MDTRIGFLMCVCVYMYVFDFDLRAYWLLFTCYCYYYELLFSFKYFYIILLVFFVNLFSFFWIDTLRRISCWDLLTGYLNRFTCNNCKCNQNSTFRYLY